MSGYDFIAAGWGKFNSTTWMNGFGLDRYFLPVLGTPWHQPKQTAPVAKTDTGTTVTVPAAG
jgi:hypothetical protein